MPDTVSFVHVEDGTKEEYALLIERERALMKKLPEHLLAREPFRQL